MIPRLMLLAFLATMAAACKAKDPLYCDENTPCTADVGRPYCDLEGIHPYSEGKANTCVPTPNFVDGGTTDDAMVSADDAQTPDAAIDAGPSCTRSAECPASSPICDGRCRPCTASPECAARNAAQPLCSVSSGRCGTCSQTSQCGDPFVICDLKWATCVEQCYLDTDCANRLCDYWRTNHCVPEPSLVYVDQNGVDGSMCGTASSPCRTIAFAIMRAGTDQTVFVRGNQVGLTTFAESLVIANRHVSIMSDGFHTGRIVAITGSILGPAVDVSGDSRVELRGIRVQGVVGHPAVKCQGSAANSPQLRVIASEVVNNGQAGILASGCNLVIERSRISDNGGDGIATFGGQLDARWTHFLKNRGYALDASGVATFRTNIVAKNTRGVRVMSTGASSISFNTIVDNSNSAVTCSGQHIASSNIVYGNLNTNLAQSGCSFRSSDLQESSSDPTNIGAPPMFRSPATDDYRLSAGSPCIDKSSDSAESGFGDIENQNRPYPLGGLYDLGADEYQP